MINVTSYRSIKRDNYIKTERQQTSMLDHYDVSPRSSLPGEASDYSQFLQYDKQMHPQVIQTLARKNTFGEP